MNSIDGPTLTTGETPGHDHRHPQRELVVTGLLATLGAVVLTTAIAALARAAGVDFEVPDGEEKIPLSGFAVVTAFASLLGVVLAVALRRWSARPSTWFLRTTVVLTLVSLVPATLSGADIATILTLVGLHLVAAAVVIPALTWRLMDAER
ncbi:DUF6069 family protein [Aeromicrobium massiliense]|uniref:DUF6069 family protein n=1 Tax=Aeromicrobium massiliense TaxID=1464554 RepID=UPI0002F4A67E|nr:DUF6069 family protein [Aeromicrobium massiliense]